jgi:hypothetical protein
MRKETWDVDLMNFIKSRETTAFEWGVFDCTLFAADCAKIMTGVDLAEKYRGYTTEMGAALIMGRAGGLRALVTSGVGPEISPKMARRGDWVLLDESDRYSLGVCMGSILIAVSRYTGIVRRPMSDAVTAWRID